MSTNKPSVSLVVLCFENDAESLQLCKSQRIKLATLAHMQSSPFDQSVSDTDVIGEVDLHPNQIVVFSIWLAF